MFSEVDNPQDPPSLANEASLVAMLGLSDQAAANDESEIDPEMVLEVLLSDESLNQLMLRRQQDDVESITGYYRVPVEPGQQRVSWHVPFVPSMPNLPACTGRPRRSIGRSNSLHQHTKIRRPCRNDSRKP